MSFHGAALTAEEGVSECGGLKEGLEDSCNTGQGRVRDNCLHAVGSKY